MASTKISQITPSQLYQKMSDWQPIETAPKRTYGVCSKIMILGHDTKKWIRFGKWYVGERAWYYSGTSERSQWSQVRGDEPTHWMPMPKPPGGLE
jgi:Protein of unknown function (DUF551)